MFAAARRNVAILIVTLFVLLYVATATAVYGFMYRSTLGGIDGQLLVDARVLLRHERVLLQPEHLRRLARLLPQVSLAAVRSVDGTLVVSSDPRLAARVDWPSLSRITPSFGPGFPRPVPGKTESLGRNGLPPLRFATLRLKDTGAYERMLAVPMYGSPSHVRAYVVLLYAMNREVHLLHRLRQVIWVVGVIGTVVAVVAGFFAAGQALRPIMRSWLRQQEFVADASHELRTPLTVIQSNLDVVLGHAQESVMDNLEWLNNAKAETRRLAKLTVDLLTLARADSNEHVLNFQRVDLGEIVGRVVDTFQPFAEDKGLKLTLEPLPVAGREADAGRAAFHVWGDPDRLHQLVFILIDNAIKYTPGGGEIHVTLSMARHSARLAVRDTGIGIAHAELERVFDRFYRSDPARARVQAGAGLGLSIARWIVEMHNGRLHLQSTVGVGSEFTVVLPQQPPRSRGKPAPAKPV